MREVARDRNPQYFVASLRQYVFAPLSTAARRVDREQTELTAERNAYEAFDDCLQSITSEAPPPRQRPAASISRHKQQVGKTDRLRTTYEETVMDISHYERVYGEPLVEHVSREFHAKFASGFKHTTSIPFTAKYKRALRQQVRQAIERRKDMLGTLREESQAISDACTSLKDISMPLQTTIIPEWHTESFTTKLNTVSKQRQKVLRTRDSIDHIDVHSLCAYLYADESWTYPVLTAVARMRETVSLEPSHLKASKTDA
jgi:hypothetical protein